MQLVNRSDGSQESIGSLNLTGAFIRNITNDTFILAKTMDIKNDKNKTTFLKLTDFDPVFSVSAPTSADDEDHWKHKRIHTHTRIHKHRLELRHVTQPVSHCCVTRGQRSCRKRWGSIAVTRENRMKFDGVSPAERLPPDFGAEVHFLFAVEPEKEKSKLWGRRFRRSDAFVLTDGGTHTASWRSPAREQTSSCRSCCQRLSAPWEVCGSLKLLLQGIWARSCNPPAACRALRGADMLDNSDPLTPDGRFSSSNAPAVPELLLDPSRNAELMPEPPNENDRRCSWWGGKGWAKYASDSTLFWVLEACGVEGGAAFPGEVAESTSGGGLDRAECKLWLWSSCTKPSFEFYQHTAVSQTQLLLLSNSWCFLLKILWF